ncbi:MAG: hypothetical protein ABIP53_01780, partial [Candidatus Limnocylindrales bacterium]
NYRETLFTPRGFLIVGGAVLLILGLLGFVILKDPSLSFFWLDTSENIAHTVLGLVALAAVFVPGLNVALTPYYRWIVILVGVIALFFGVYGFLLPAGSAGTPNTFGLANLELGDNLLHLVVAAWAFLAAFWSSEPGMMRR